MERVDVQRVAEELTTARPPLDAERQRIAIALYRLLADGAPVSPRRLVERANGAHADVAGVLEGPYGVDRDVQGDIVGFWGLTLSVTPHRLNVDGETLHAWCAWDTLFLPALLGATIDVVTSCPATRAPITLTVTPDSVERLAPASAVLSLRHPDERFTADTRSSFCCHVHLFTSFDAFATSPARDPATFAVSVGDGLEIARRVNHATYTEAVW